MAFDPMAFMKPDKAFSMEGLLSRDMFEKFAAPDEAAYNQLAFGGDYCEDYDDPYPGYPSRLHFLAGLITKITGDIVTWVNQYGELSVFVGSILTLIYGSTDPESQQLYRLTMDDGPELSESERLGTIRLIRKGLMDGISGVTMTDIERIDENGQVLYKFYIMLNGS